MEDQDQSEKAKPISLVDHLTKQHGEKVLKVINALHNEFNIIENIDISLTLKDALLQTLVVEISQDYNNLTKFFNVEGDPLLYYKEDLTEVPGLDEARKEFDKELILKSGKKLRISREEGDELDTSDFLTSKLVFERAVREKKAA